MSIRLIRIAEDLLESFGTRTDDGRKLTAEWGPVVAYAGDSRGIECDIYEPVFTATDDGMVVLPAEALAVVKAAEAYSPREDHDWRCEYRTAAVGWKEGDPPVIRCECGRDDLDSALAAFRSRQPEPVR